MGAYGLLGSMLSRRIEEIPLFNLHRIDHVECDISFKDDIRCFVEKYQPEIIINCAAYTDVDGCEKNKDYARSVNSEGVKNVAQVCERNGIWLVHVSSDAVFGDSKPHAESDRTCPCNYYGKTKDMGEKYLMDSMDNYFIVRTSSLFGPDGKNFVDTVNLSVKMGGVDVVNDQVTQPSYTKDVADGIVRLIEEEYGFGIYHIVNSGCASWYELACETSSEENFNPISSSEMKRDAKRPRLSYIENNKMRELRPWKNALRDYLYGSY